MGLPERELMGLDGRGIAWTDRNGFTMTFAVVGRVQGEVFPPQSPYDATDIHYGHLVSRCDAADRFAAVAVSANLNNVVCHQPCAAISLPPATSTLPNRIQAVVADCANKQMTRSDTTWVITVMQDVKPSRDLFICENPGDAVRILHSAVEPEPAVASRAFLRRPLPAAIRRPFHLFPESSLDILGRHGGYSE